MGAPTIEDQALRAAYTLAVDAVEADAFDALRSAGARPILLKGRSIAKLLYPAGTRVSHDVDLLVDPRREREATEALAGLGYRHHWLGPSPRLSGGEMWVRTASQPPIDLHVALPFVRTSPPEAFDLLAARSVAAPAREGEVVTLDPPAIALHVALHALLDGPDNPRTQEDLRRACAMLPASTWRESAELAQALAAIDGLAAGLSLLPEGARVAREVGLPRYPGSLVADLATRGLPKLVPGVLTLAAEPGWPARLRTLARLLAPSPSRQRDRWALARRGSSGLIASYLIWPFYVAGASPRLAFALARSWWRTRAAGPEPRNAYRT